MSEKELLECLQKDTALGIETAIEQYGKAVICSAVLLPADDQGDRHYIAAKNKKRREPAEQRTHETA